jgi:hypothetical protein
VSVMDRLIGICTVALLLGYAGVRYARRRPGRLRQYALFLVLLLVLVATLIFFALPPGDWSGRAGSV